jgi:hypothetical protein
MTDCHDFPLRRQIVAVAEHRIIGGVFGFKTGHPRMRQRAPWMRWYGLERWRQRAKTQLRIPLILKRSLHGGKS